MVGTFKTIHLMPKPQVQIDTKSASLFDQNRYSYPIGPNLAQFGPIDPFCHWCRVK